MHECMLPTLSQKSWIKTFNTICVFMYAIFVKTVYSIGTSYCTSFMKYILVLYSFELDQNERRHTDSDRQIISD